jgi:hypothetical protein
MVALCANNGPMFLSKALEAFRRSRIFPSAHPSVGALSSKAGVRRLSKTRVNDATNWPIAFLPAAQQRTGKDPLRSSPVIRRTGLHRCPSRQCPCDGPINRMPQGISFALSLNTNSLLVNTSPMHLTTKMVKQHRLILSPRETGDTGC